jgi:cutinase
MIIGPQTCSALKRKLPDKVACQGVGGAYKASMADNGKAQFTDPAAIQVRATQYNYL